jgi:tetratricopeptide (TPR) repeat protein
MRSRGGPSERTIEGTTASPAAEPRVQPGAVSALLEELARAPERDIPEPWDDRLRAGSIIGRFELLREIGRGGFGVVFEARDLELGRLVAFKALRPGPQARAISQEALLRREAEAAALLNHPNVCSLYDVGSGEIGPYLILELLHGETLEDRLLRGGIPREQAVSIALAVASALAHAHATGVVHRDLKPGNVFLTERGEVKVLDFGLATFLGGPGPGGSGTPAYMAPEQWRGTTEDARTDVFALGVILHEMLAGARPFEVSRDRSTVLDPGPPPELPPGCAPGRLAALVARMLSKDPEGRPRNGQVVREAILEALATTPSTTERHPPPAGSTARIGRWGQFVDELHRRRVPGASMAYLATGFLLLLAADVASWTLDLPRWVLTAASLVVLAGFPVNALVAWYVDALPIRGRGPGAPGRAAPGRLVLRKPGTTAVAALVVLALAAAAWRWWPRADPPLGERTLVVVADCANETADPELNGLSGMLTTSLEQSRRLALLSRGRMIEILQQAGMRDVERIDEARGRKVAQLTGARAVLLPTIHRFEEVYAVEIQVLDPSTNDYLFTLKEQGRKSSVPGMIDALSERVREGLHESARDIRVARVPVASATTANLEAYHHYFEAVRRFEVGDTAGALREFRRAVSIDPSFALAHYQIAFLGEGSRRLPRSLRQASVDAALQGAPRLGPREQLLIEAWSAHFLGRDDQAETVYRRLVEAYPRDKEALYAAGDHFHHRGKAAEALPYFERALALDPGWGPPLYHLIGDLLDLGRSDEAVAAARRAVGAEPTIGSLDNLLFALVQRGELEEALDISRRQLALGGGALAIVNGGEIRLLMEDSAGAAREAEGLLSPERPLDDQCAGRHLLVKALALAGRRREALQLAKAPLAEASDTRQCHEHDPLADLLAGDGPPSRVRDEVASAMEVDPTVIQSAALAAYGGDLDHAAKLAADLDGPWRTLHDGVVRWRSGDTERALALFREASVPREGPRVLAAFLEGQIHAEAGRHGPAEVHLREFLASANWPYWPMWRSWAQPRARLLLARSLAEAGRADEARSELARLLRLWANADPDLPDLLAARALESRLAAAAR